MKKKKIKLAAVILAGICAVVWPLNVILDITGGTYQSEPLDLVLDAICAVLWIAVFVMNLIAYRREKNQ